MFAKAFESSPVGITTPLMKTPSKRSASDHFRPREKTGGKNHYGRTHSEKTHGGKTPGVEAAVEGVMIYGVHAVEAALLNPARHIRKAWATLNALQRLAEPMARRGVAPETATPKDLDRRLGEDTVHQGVLIEVDPLPTLDVEDLAEARLVLALDQITDPHNVGAVLRSAAAFGVEGVIMTARHSPPLSGVLAKAACGGLEYVPIALVTNLAQALTELGELGFWRIGLDSEAQGAIEQATRYERLALVLGAEDAGLRRLTRERCDVIMRLTTAEGAEIKSLNVSNAAAIALHHASLNMLAPVKTA
jgi:23S rRNA (guanosine2251-2'-O)-methyltransferase